VFKFDISKIFLSIILFCFLFSFKVSNAQNLNTKGIEISSDNFSMKIEDSFMIFNKNVVIAYTAFNAKCDKATVTLDKKTKKVQKVIMEGNVKIQRSNASFSGDKVTLEIQGGKLSIDGDVKAKMEFQE